MKKLLDEFKDFIAGGNLIELAIAFIIGLAIKAVLDSLVKDIIMPLVGAIFGKVSFDGLTVTIHKSIIHYGSFITAVVNFLIVAFVIFIMFKAYTAMIERVKGPKTSPDEAPDEIELLTQIRDSLAQRG